jgi:superfamily I DNA and/or RNA helicase
LVHSISPSKPVVFIGTDGLGNGLEDIGPINRVESVITSKLVLALSAAGLYESSIGIITPFRSQVSLLLRVMFQGQMKGICYGWCLPSKNKVPNAENTLMFLSSK